MVRRAVQEENHSAGEAVNVQEEKMKRDRSYAFAGFGLLQALFFVFFLERGPGHGAENPRRAGLARRYDEHRRSHAPAAATVNQNRTNHLATFFQDNLKNAYQGSDGGKAFSFVP